LFVLLPHPVFLLGSRYREAGVDRCYANFTSGNTTFVARGTSEVDKLLRLTRLLAQRFLAPEPAVGGTFESDAASGDRDACRMRGLSLARI
jgi:hypothetical protein